MMTALLIWRTWDMQLTLAAWLRARRREGMRMPISAAMIPITTSSSTSVKPAKPATPIPGRRRVQPMMCS